MIGCEVIFACTQRRRSEICHKCCWPMNGKAALLDLKMQHCCLFSIGYTQGSWRGAHFESRCYSLSLGFPTRRPKIVRFFNQLMKLMKRFMCGKKTWLIEFILLPSYTNLYMGWLFFLTESTPRMNGLVRLVGWKKIDYFSMEQMASWLLKPNPTSSTNYIRKKHPPNYFVRLRTSPAS